MAVLSEEAQGPRAAKDDELEQGFKHKGPTERERDREVERERWRERRKIRKNLQKVFM